MSIQDFVKIFLTRRLPLAELASLVRQVDLAPIFSLPEDTEALLFTLAKFGLALELDEDNYAQAKARHAPLDRVEFCVVDIESTGSARSGQIIELAAVKISARSGGPGGGAGREKAGGAGRGGAGVAGGPGGGGGAGGGGEREKWRELGRFSSLIFAEAVPEEITQLTGINAAMLASAPGPAEVLGGFRAFLGGAIFVAHNVGFDYSFISQECLKLGLGPLFNPRICSLELARRLIPAPKHGLEFLKEQLGIKGPSHRALNDALIAAEVLRHCLDRLPRRVGSVGDLFHFLKNTPRLKKAPQG